MELVEQVGTLISTFGELAEIINNKTDKSEASEDLEETIDLVEAGVNSMRLDKDLFAKNQGLKKSMEILKQNLIAAKESLEKHKQNKGGFFGWFKKSNEDELKSHEKKLKNQFNLVNSTILNISRSKSKKRKSEELTKTTNGSNKKSRADISDIIKSPSAKEFWEKHFVRLYEVPWNRFKAAFEYEYENQEEHRMKILKEELDKNNDDMIDVYEFAKFIQNREIMDCFRDLQKRASNNRKRRNSAIYSEDGKNIIELNTKKVKFVDEQNNPKLRDPQVTSSIPSVTSSSNHSLHKKLVGCEIRLFGTDPVMAALSKEVPGDLKMTGNLDTPISFGRMRWNVQGIVARHPVMFNVLNKISRENHLVIEYQKEGNNNTTTTTADGGFYVTGKGKSKLNGTVFDTKTKLNDGDEIVLVYSVGQVKDLGFTFHLLFNYEEVAVPTTTPCQLVPEIIITPPQDV